MLAGALYFHYSRFGRMEYEQATWQYNLKQFGSWIMVGAILLGAYGFYAMNSAAATSAPVLGAPSTNSQMPALSVPQMGGGFRNVANTALGRINSLMRHGRINI